MVCGDDSPNEEEMLMSDDDQPPNNFSFTFCPHGNCTTTTCAVYPSPPLSDSHATVPLPAPHFGGVLDSPVVLMKRPSPTPLTPPLTIATLTLPLPSMPNHAQSDLLSPLSPQWPSNRAEEDEFLQDSVLMSQSSVLGSLEPPYPDLASENDAESCTQSAADVLMYSDDRNLSPLSDDDLLPPPLVSSDGTSSVDSSPPSPLFSEALSPPDSPSFSFHKLEELDSAADGLGLGFIGSGPSWLLSSPPLLSFAPLDTPELDDLGLDMDFGPGFGPSVSPSRRSITSLPLFDELGNAYISPEEPEDRRRPPDNSSEPSATSSMPNALCLDVPLDHTPKTPSSILDAFTAAELRERLPPYLPEEELDGLLAVRARAEATHAECVAALPTSCAPTILDHELRRSVHRDAGEPRRRRKRAKELGRELDALIGFALGILPDSSATMAKQRDDLRQGGVLRDKAGFAGLENLSQLIARMILRRRERCGVRGIESSAWQSRCLIPSPLSQSFSLLDAEEDLAA